MKRMIIVMFMGLLTSMCATAQPGGRYGYGRRHLPAPPPPAYRASRYSTPSSSAPVDFYYGLRLGLNVSSVSSADRYLDGGTAKAGLNLGMVAGVQLAPATPVYLESGLYYSEKGGKGTCDGKTFTYQLNYLEVPLLMKYRIDIDRYTSVQPFAGVYAAVGVGGKMKDFNNRKAYSAFDDDAFQRLDAGLRLGCGLQFAPVYMELGYDVGLANISHDYFDTAHTGAFFATVGVNF